MENSTSQICNPDEPQKTCGCALALCRARELIIGPLKVNNLLLIMFFTTHNLTVLPLMYKDNGKTWLSMLFLEVITFHLSY